MFVVLIGGCVSTSISVPRGEEYYTRTNIWYKDPAKIPSTNYIDGAFLPLGTKIKMLDCGGVQVKFVDINRGQSYTIIFVRKHTTITAEEQFDRYFSKRNVVDTKGDFFKLSPKEQEAVKKGAIFDGMSKKAVLMALGYPPSHKTPDLTSNVWFYWGHRAVFSVYFMDDVVVKYDSEMRVSPFETRWQYKTESLGQSAKDSGIGNGK